MPDMNISPDSIVLWETGPVSLNATILFTWLVMLLLVIVSWLTTRKLKIEPPMSRFQNLLETTISFMRKQIHEIAQDDPDPYLPFIGTLFLFIVVSNLLSIVPGYQPPTGSLSTTAALAVCVFFAVPIFGISRQGLGDYLKHYIQPSVFMLPFNIISELSRTLALAVRLFGNVMSGTMIAGILISIIPLFVPVVMQILSLLIGIIQAYIFAVLATVYVASGVRLQNKQEEIIDQ
jgi:F-type H+-transporting ATPase subunit a